MLLVVYQTRERFCCCQLSKIYVPILKLFSLLIFIAAIETIFGIFAFFACLNWIYCCLDDSPLQFRLKWRWGLPLETQQGDNRWQSHMSEMPNGDRCHSKTTSSGEQGAKKLEESPSVASSPPIPDPFFKARTNVVVPAVGLQQGQAGTLACHQQ